MFLNMLKKESCPHLSTGMSISNYKCKYPTTITAYYLSAVRAMLFSWVYNSIAPGCEWLYLSTATLNKKLVKVGHMGIKGGSSLVNHLVD